MRPASGEHAEVVAVVVRELPAEAGVEAAQRREVLGAERDDGDASGNGHGDIV